MGRALLSVEKIQTEQGKLEVKYTESSGLFVALIAMSTFNQALSMVQLACLAVHGKKRISNVPALDYDCAQI